MHFQIVKKQDSKVVKKREVTPSQPMIEFIAQKMTIIDIIVSKYGVF